MTEKLHGANLCVLIQGQRLQPAKRKALLAPRRPWNGSLGSMLAVAAVTSFALKFWTSGNPVLIIGSCAVLVILGRTAYATN